MRKLFIIFVFLICAASAHAQTSGNPLCGGNDDGNGHLPSDLVNGANDWATFTPPATIGGTYVDQLGVALGGAGCTIKRLTIGGDTAHYYSTTSAMNYNDTYIFVAGQGTCGVGSGWCVIDLSGNVIVTFSHMPSFNGVPMWCPGPNFSSFYYTTGTQLRLATVNGVNSVSSVLVHDFTGTYSSVTIPDETRVSYDGSTVGLIGEHTGTGQVALDAFSFNVNTLTSSHIFTTQTSGSNGTTASGATLCTVTGNTTLGATDIGGCFHKSIMTTENALELELHPNLDTGMPASCVSAFNAGFSCKALIGSGGTLSIIMFGTTHSDTYLSLTGNHNMRIQLWDSNPNGNAGSDPCWKNGGHSVLDEDNTSSITCVFTTVFTGGHLSTSGTGPNQPWALVSYDDTSRPQSPEWFSTSANYAAPTSTYPGTNTCSQGVTGGSALAKTCWYPYESEGILLRVDSVGNATSLGGTSNKVWRLFWSRTRDSSSAFWGTQRSSLSPDGKYVVFSSSMAYPAGNCASPSDLACDDVYLAGPFWSGSTAATPVASPGAGTYSSSQSVTLSNPSSAPVICYNTTGSPATNGTSGCTTGSVYSGAITVSSSETLYFVAGGTGFTDSSVGSAAYVINLPSSGSSMTSGTLRGASIH